MPPAVGVAAAVVGAAATVGSAIIANKQAKEQQKAHEKALEQQKKDAEQARKEAEQRQKDAKELADRQQANQNALNAASTETGATVELGTASSDAVLKRGSKKTNRSRQQDTTGTGGVKASKVGGL